MNKLLTGFIIRSLLCPVSLKLIPSRYGFLDGVERSDMLVFPIHCDAEIEPILGGEDGPISRSAPFVCSFAVHQVTAMVRHLQVYAAVIQGVMVQMVDL